MTRPRFLSAGWLLAALTALAPPLSGCTRSPAPAGIPAGSGAPGYGGRFVYPLPIEPATLNFVTGTDQPSRSVTRLVGDSLVDHDREMRLVPRLAASWDWSTDGRVLTFHLRSGARFHDGTPVTSADVVYTYQRVVDPKSRAIGRLDSFLPVERVEAPDPLTVRVTYRAPFAPALEAWEVPILPLHLYAKDDFLRSPLNRAPIGSGPFRFASWEPGQRIVLTANDDYWGGRPYLDTFEFDLIPSQETALRALLAGEVDYAALTPVQWDARARETSFGRRFRTIRFVPLFLYYIAWRGDGSNPFFADPVVRRALTLALDRDGYVRSVLRGLGQLASSPFRPGSLGADPDSAVIPFDPAQAAALLDGAGWRRDPRTGLRGRSGIPFRFTLLIYGGGEDHVQFSQVAQEALRRLGIDMEISRLDWPTLWSRLQQGDFEAAISGGSALGLDPDSVYGALHSSQIEGGQNYAAFRDMSIDRWLEEGRRILDQGRRAEIYRAIEQRIREEQPYTYLFHPVVQAALSRRIANAEPSPLGILDHWPGPARFYVARGGPP